MKLKQSPDDFVVEELTNVLPAERGEFAFYQLDKVGWTTPDALAAIRRRWKLDHRRVSYGGLKDRHARTTQYLTVYRGPRRNLTHERITVTYLGQVAEPYTAAHIRSNGFTLTLRSVATQDRPKMETALAEVERVGMPNYFDDQRFGSVSERSAFVAREMVFGRFEDALRLALVSPYEHDRREQKREKEILTRLWGDWPACKAALPRGHARSLVDYLCAHPHDFRGAVARLRPELQGLYLSAYQSHLWNRMLARWLTKSVPIDCLAGIRQKHEIVPTPTRLPAEVSEAWQSLRLPLPSARLKPDPLADWQPIVEAVLAEEGLTLATMKIPGLQKPFFSKGDRAGCVRPAGLNWEFTSDDRHSGRQKLILRFELPRGSYATMLIKRITAVVALNPTTECV
jgi:tRNA pseudouridine13 synthase